MAAFVARGVPFGFENVGVFPEQVPPFTEADAYVENGLRLELADQVDDGRDRVGPAAGHVIGV